MYYILTDKQQRKSKKTNTHIRSNKINEEKQQKNRNGNVQSVTTCKKRQKISEADSFRNIKVKHHTHLKMDM
jgi:hypothetical protein